MAFNLVSWIQLAALPDKAWDIKRWRYRLFATAGKSSPAPQPTPAPGEGTGKNLLKLLLENIARLTKGLVPSTG